MAAEFYSESDNLAELVSHMPEDDRRRFNSYGHLRVEAAFVDRVFIVYRPTGLNPSGSHKEPEVLTTIRVMDFSASARNGCEVTLLDQQFDQELRVGHVPKRLFGHHVYVSIPPRIIVKWDAKNIEGGVWRSLAFGLLIKTRNRSSFYSKGNCYLESPNSFRQLYPNVTGRLEF